MKLTAALLLSSALACAQTNTLTPQQAADGWLLLFDGTSLFGWTQEQEAKWRVEAGELIADAGGNGWLRSNSAFADYILRCDFKTGPTGNSGIFLRSAKDGQPHVTGYELQIFNQHPKFPTGSLVNHIAAAKVEPAADQWHTYEVTVNGDRFIVKLDGRQILDGRDSKSKSGHIGLQYNKDNRIAFRNIRIKPLNLQPIFNGRNLDGWHEVQPPRPPKEKAIWTVDKGLIHVLHGSGQLETGKTWDDFILQLDIRCNSDDPGRHPNSGVFIRGDRDGFWTGYESQIRNEFKDGDRTKPVDYGTGAIYGRIATRKVVSSDNEFFTMTIDARGPHIVVWVNGYPVTDWEDTRPPDASARKGARIAAGTISLQAHDPTTNLDFNNLRVASFPK